MYEMPSAHEPKLEISLDYAKSKVEKANINRLKIA
jgi:hypothetical protein